ncbi:integral membrane sensor signal transduction histidine kinase [Pseudodesulfovibrio mercurii]|uniref:histidine kinase n=1 Tax=Pseudodesulfovibrio mercurii TaxID=641491 RepID=F0JBQ0_9BACT|nr:HAMP domain-containing sensor histidine kinase [Pseudodesulfovibrio mercurii]EGB15553.1 integral membrane sensor signal transduction histidine kinase [Pseudodesulfovibrio mercurii]
MRLYTKFMIWSVLNLVWLGVVVLGGSWLLIGSNGAYAQVLFRGGINSVMQVVAANLQYKPIYDWQKVLDRYSESYDIRFHVQALDDMGHIPTHGAIPDTVMAEASKMPKPQVSFCAEPGSSERQDINAVLEAESGFLPMQNAIYLRAGDPTRYWYGRPVFVPDENHKLHYVLLISSSTSFSGHGLYFNMYGVLVTMVVVLGLCFLWWWPFVWHLAKPIGQVTEKAERIAAGEYVLTEKRKDDYLPSLGRKDEIRRLADAVDSMSNQLMQQMFRQRRFIRQIAHELGSPIARTKFGLAVLEERLDGDFANRARKISRDVEEIAVLVEDVLGYLRSEGLPGQPRIEIVPLYHTINEIIALEGQSADIEFERPEQEFYIRTDLECLRRMVGNALRNAIRYAAEQGVITIRVQCLVDEVLVSVEDNGPGVPPTELAHLTEPFFRGEGAADYPGGSGLGLSIVKQCMEICGGRLEFANRSPHGFAVSLFFPLSH